MLFQYTHLATNAIRLVRFAPSSTPSDIHLTLQHQERYYEERSDYTALWCDPYDSPSKSVTLQGRTRVVPGTVWDALSAVLAHHKSPAGSRFWVEALCVNARDEVEKQQQLAQRTRIYGCAERVVVWAGSAEADGSTALNTPSQLGAGGDVSRGQEQLKGTDLDAAAVDNLAGKIKLDSLPEYVKGAKNVLVMCGKDMFDGSMIERLKVRSINDGAKAAEKL